MHTKLITETINAKCSTIAMNHPSFLLPYSSALLVCLTRLPFSSSLLVLLNRLPDSSAFIYERQMMYLNHLGVHRN